MGSRKRFYYRPSEPAIESMLARGAEAGKPAEAERVPLNLIEIILAQGSSLHTPHLAPCPHAHVRGLRVGGQPTRC